MRSSSSSGEEVNSPIPTLCAREAETALLSTYQTTGSLCPSTQDQMALLNPQGCLTTQRHKRGDPLSHPMCCPFPLHLHPQAGLDAGPAEAKAQPLLPLAARSLPTARIPTSRCSPRQNARAGQPALPLPKAAEGNAASPGSRGREPTPLSSATQVCRAPGNGVYEGRQQQGESARNHCLIDTAIKAKTSSNLPDSFFSSKRNRIYLPFN